MRNTLPLLSRPPLGGSSQNQNQPPSNMYTPPQQIPSIRFISATPSEANISRSAIASFSSSPLAPRTTNTNEAPRKRIVPKKSKLGLLGGGKTKEKVNKDFSDVVRRVGGDAPSTGRGFEIYVDHAEDPDIGEIVVVKKKKSRLGINGMKWGALGEVTNVPSAQNEKDMKPQENLLKVKSDENHKWWSIGRGRKDVKENVKSESRDKSQTRSKTPEPPKPVDTRARFNSLDAGVTLAAASQPRTQTQRNGTVSSMATLLTVPETEARSTTPGLLAPPSSGPASGSIAVRAMRSMRSLARMKSWANMGTSNSDKEANIASANDAPTTTTTTTIATTVTTSKTKEKSEGKKKKEKKKDKEQEKKTLRLSESSFEAGALSSQGSPAPPIRPTEETAKRKQSKLGLGLPSTMRLGTVRHISNASSAFGVPQQPPATMAGRLSVESAHLIMGPNGRPASTISSGSSLRPPSTASGVSAFSTRSARSSSSSVASVRWDEEHLQTTKEMQRRERRTRRESAEEQGRTSRESRRSSEGRRRTPVMDVFPEIRQGSVSPKSTLEQEHPIVTVEEATADGHEVIEEEEEESPASATPIKRARPRPMSEQLLGKARPKPINDDADGVLSILDAATNDLASLINRLDLEATPASTNNSPMKRTPLSLRVSPSNASLGMPGDGSPTKAKLMFNKKTDAPLLAERDSVASIQSLRPYAQMQATNRQTNPAIPNTRQQAMDPVQARKLIGQQIVPWSTLDWQVSPKKPIKPVSTFRPTHKRTPTPAPAIDPPPVFQPLRPAMKNRISPVEVLPSAASTPNVDNTSVHPSSQTFGSDLATSKIGRVPSADLDYDEPAPPSPSPPHKRTSGRHSRKPSVLSAMCDTGAILPPEAMKSLGLTGTMGGAEPEVDPEDPDSDIPDELQNILSGQSDDESVQAFDDTLSIRHPSPPPSPGMPPLARLPTPTSADDLDVPVFRATLVDEEANTADIYECDESDCENDTNKSFDFTGELQKLNDSGGSDRRSFVEQLENAFRTPARMDLGFELAQKLFEQEVPPVPALPLMHRETPGEDLVPRSVTDPDMSSFNFEESVAEPETAPEEPSYRESATSDTLDHLLAECEDDICRPYPEMRRSQTSMRSKESDGKLNTSFRFGGKPSIPDLVDESEDRPLTLSDIIPPLSHSLAHSRSRSESSIVEEDSSVLKSILGQAYEDDTSVVNSIMAQAADVLPPARPRPRLDSDTSSKRLARESLDLSKTSSHSRNTSEASFTGLDSFDEIRRGFEFGPNRPAFYPPPGAAARTWHNRHESVYSIASVSSYGAIVHSGSLDPFGYAPSSRPVSDDMSTTMSLTVDDTFSFLKKDPHQRKRVDSDASSFYFRGASTSFRRGHRRNESNFSVASNAPPVSLYNRSFGAHRRNDSSGSVSSVAQSYAMHGSYGGRAAWARHHRQEASTDSIMSDFSAAHIGRPGIGDKMFDMDYGMPLTAITASPAESVFSQQQQQTAMDSIFDTEPIISVEDSLFEKTGFVASYSNENPFEFDASQAPEDETFLRKRQFRPLSILSVASFHTMAHEDDTMITMLGGGHVRRRSVDSGIEGSPCINLERKKATALQHLARALRFDQHADELPQSVADRMSKVSPDRVVMPKASIASTSSYQFGDERMIMARRGLLERQSLEDSALMAHGEEIIASLESTQVFSRPIRGRVATGGRSRSSTCTSSSGVETPPLSASDTSSISSGSQSSIDLNLLNTLLSNASLPSSSLATARARARGAGHRRRLSAARASRSSVYETIREESVGPSSSPSPTKPEALAHETKELSQIPQDSIYIVDPERTSIISDWDDENGIVTMRQYFALRDEAQETVTESKRLWIDTAFSVFALQSFQPPKNRGGMQALLQHSKENYGPLPSELRPHRVRSRTSSRPSPYPVRSQRSTVSPEQSYCSGEGKPFASADEHSSASVLSQISINPNVAVFSPPPSLDVKPFSPFAVELETSKTGKKAFAQPRPRVTSSARRTALGWSKRNNKANASHDKENKENVGQGSLLTPSDSLRLSRPRPRGRPTPARRVPVPTA